MSTWPLVLLSEVLKSVERPEIPLAGKPYRQLGVQLWGVGAYERETIDGGATRYKTLCRVEADDISVNKIWARNGSVAVVPASLGGCYVSGEFPTFIAVSDKLDPRWFHWITKTRFFGISAMGNRAERAAKIESAPSVFWRSKFLVPHFQSSGGSWRGLKNWPPESTRRMS